jgi:hypothetical protein
VSILAPSYESLQGRYDIFIYSNWVSSRWQRPGREREKERERRIKIKRGKRQLYKKGKTIHKTIQKYIK